MPGFRHNTLDSSAIRIQTLTHVSDVAILLPAAPFFFVCCRIEWVG